jgi:hypothetical protein
MNHQAFAVLARFIYEKEAARIIILGLSAAPVHSQI